MGGDMRLRNKKTGEVEEIILKLNESLPDAIRRTIEEAGWEETRKPLIKDEKIRKAVRAWAEANGIDDIVAYILEDGIEFAGNATKLDIRFVQNLVIDTDRKYTITELCGEEEE